MNKTAQSMISDTTVGGTQPQRIPSDPAPAVAPTPPPGTLRGKPSLSMVGLLAVTMVIGYEWFISGLVKFVRGDFPAGLADELQAKVETTSGWYGNFMTNALIPNGNLFGYFVETSELLAGIALIAGPLILLFGWDRISDRIRSVVLLAIGTAAIGGAVLAINLHLANGGNHPWLLPGDAFDEGIDLDSVLPAIQIVIGTVSFILLRRLRRSGADTATSDPSSFTAV
jgi:hypothetical protein